jgi:uncharacterized membrane protein
MNKEFWIGVSAILGTLPIIFIKEYIHSPNIVYIIIIVISYVSLTYTYYKLFQLGNMSKLYPIAKIISISIVVVTGILLFGDELTPKVIIGLIFTITAILLLW